MSSKHKRGAASPQGAGRAPRDEVDRLIAKGWYKDAVKQAKICHRDQPSPEHHRLLERAYLLRAQELRDNGMPTAAQEVAGHLLDFGITDPALTEPAATLMMAVGLAGRALELQGRLDAPEALDRLTRQGADQAVLHPERASTMPTETREGAKRIRSALEALTAGDEARALDELRDVSRTSPFADWRLFARGLAAFRRGEDADARSNWDRLDPSRSASRIARALISATEPVPREGPPVPKLEGLERWALGEPMLKPLRDLSEALGQGLWPEVVRGLGSLRLALRRFDPALAVRLTQALYPLVIREAMDLNEREGRNLLKSFTKAAEALPIDPRWDRLWALVWDGPQGHPAEAEPYWRRYIEDLEASTLIRPEQKPLARALILTHLGKEWANLAADLESDDFGLPRSAIPEEVRDARRRASASLEESLRLFPSHRPTYEALMDLYKDEGNPDRAAEIARRLLDKLPDDLDALEHLSDHHFHREEPARALEYTLRARKLKPLDPKIQNGEWGCRVALARQQALNGRWDEARSELETAARLVPELASSPHFAARRASLEIKAGQPVAADSILDEAKEKLVEPAPLWLAMAIEARRFQLPKAEINRFESLWQKSASGKAQGETAGALALLLGSFLSGKITYPGRAEHEKQVAEYLGRTTRIKYSLDDLTAVCSFLGFVNTPANRALQEKLAKRGLKLFPTSPDFPAMLGSAELAKGPAKANIPVARRHFEDALKLAQTLEQVDPKAAAKIPEIQRILATLTELMRGPMGFGPMSMPFGRGGPGLGAMYAAIEEMMEAGIDPDDLFDVDDDFDDPPASRPRPKGRKR